MFMLPSLVHIQILHANEICTSKTSSKGLKRLSKFYKLIQWCSWGWTQKNKKQLPVNVDVHVLPKIFVAAKTEAHEALS